MYNETQRMLPNCDGCVMKKIKKLILDCNIEIPKSVVGSIGVSKIHYFHGDINGYYNNTKKITDTHIIRGCERRSSSAYDVKIELLKPLYHKYPAMYYDPIRNRIHLSYSEVWMPYPEVEAVV